MQFHFTVGLKYKIQLTHIKKFLLVAGEDGILHIQ